ncbi:3-oxoacyl-ACP reductase family protein [Candidatus Poriferisodalis multihospitum]|uniref:3-oxoacyl-ACP reductase family protein n=1 Tax=Candidatus Poriferisodalis multihospitum TaxID=2983191 RepID=UPI002B260DA9|nr:3-oxoacyl-ACP reductase family protein [Candidatus Poriferisodalis multihospitum]
MSLHGRCVVVTGAGRGLGEAMAHAIAAEDGSVVVAELVPERGEQVTSDIKAAGGAAEFVPTDVSDESSVADLSAHVAGSGGLWALVNNAGLADAVGGKTFWDITPDEWDRIHTINARGPWLVSRALAPQMIGTGEGRIVNIASDAALYGSPRLAHYVASKGALIALTRAMARELGDHGITVNAVAPGLTEGPSAERIPAERHALYAANRAITRPQQPDDVVGAVNFLLSDEAAYITGQTIVVDGGFVMP